MEKHQCEQPGELTWWLATEKRAQEACQPDGLGGELGPLHRRTPRSGVALVEQQVEDGENAVQTRGHLACLRDHVGDVRRGNLALGSDKALSHRGRRDHERAGDLVRVEAEQCPETQRHLGFQRQGRVAAGKHESKQIVRDLDRLRGRERFIDGEGVGLELGGQHLLAAQAVGREVPRRLDQPGPRVLRNTAIAPARQRGLERVLGRLLGKAEVSRQPDQRGQDAPPLGAINIRNQRGNVAGHARC